jgi:hypothetical protein
MEIISVLEDYVKWKVEVLNIYELDSNETASDR